MSSIMRARSGARQVEKDAKRPTDEQIEELIRRGRENAQMLRKLADEIDKRGKGER